MNKLFPMALMVMLLMARADGLQAFKAPDEKRPSVTSVGISDTALDLETLFTRDLNHPSSGDLVEAAGNLVGSVMQAEFERLATNQERLPNTGKGLPLFTSEVSKVETDHLGFTHIRLRQTYEGLPVVGGELIVHFNNHGVAYQINGKYLPPVDISLAPSITAETALQVGLAAFVDKTEVVVGKSPSLVIFGRHLAYHFVILHGGREIGEWWHYVDANTGALLQRYNNVRFFMGAPTPGNGKPMTVSGSRLTGEGGAGVKLSGWKEKRGNFYLYDFNHVWGVYDQAQGDWEQQAASDWGSSDRAAISAGRNFSLTQDWVKSVLERNGFDGSGTLARANIHSVSCDGTPNNACWVPALKQFFFGDGDLATADPLSVLDIVAHEYGHAITEYTSKLGTYGESGALDESFSDIMAVTVEFAKQADGKSSYPYHSAGHSDWLLGEDAWRLREALRDMREPQRFGQPSYYRGTDWYTGTGDYAAIPAGIAKRELTGLQHTIFRKRQDKIESGAWSRKNSRLL